MRLSSGVLIQCVYFGLLKGSYRQLPHHVAKFIKLYFSVPVLVYLRYQFVQVFVGGVDAQRLTNFVWRNRSTVVFVEEAEGCFKFFIRY